MNKGMEIDRQRARYLRGCVCVEGTNDALATKQRHQLVRSSSKERWKRQCSRRESNPFARVPGELGKGNGESQRVSERERERGGGGRRVSTTAHGYGEP